MLVKGFITQSCSGASTACSRPGPRAGGGEREGHNISNGERCLWARERCETMQVSAARSRPGPRAGEGEQSGMS